MNMKDLLKPSNPTTVRKVVSRMKTHTYKIDSFKDREAMFVAFANSGYKVRLIEKADQKHYGKTIYYVEVSK